jgi:hypothetical protein
VNHDGMVCTKMLRTRASTWTTSRPRSVTPARRGGRPRTATPPVRSQCGCTSRLSNWTLAYVSTAIPT